MKKKIETEVTITIKIEGSEFYLTKAEAEDLYTALQDALGKNIVKIQSTISDCDPHAHTPPITQNPHYPFYPLPNQIYCGFNNHTPNE